MKLMHTCIYSSRHFPCRGPDCVLLIMMDETDGEKSLSSSYNSNSSNNILELPQTVRGVDGTTQSYNRYSHQLPEGGIDVYFTAFGSYRPKVNDPLYKHIIFWVISFCFYSYGISAISLMLYTAVINNDAQRFWVLFNATTFLKCCMIHIVLVRNAEQIVNFPRTMEYGKLCSRAYPISLRYFAISSTIYAIVMIGWSVLRFGDFPTPFWVLFSFSIVFGTFGYVCYVASVMLFCVADSLLIHKKISSLKIAAENEILTKQQYFDTYSFISDIKKQTFRNNELILASVILNTAALAIVLFTYQYVTNERTLLYTAWFLAYVVCMLWLSDVVYLFSVLPSMSKANDDFIELQKYMVKSNWKRDLEMQRHDVLHAMLICPIRITMFGMHLTTTEVRNRLLGMIVFMLSITVKFVASIVTAYE